VKQEFKCAIELQLFDDRIIFNSLLLATFPPKGREHSPLHNGLGLTPAAAVRLARRHARPINALGDDQPTLSALYYDVAVAALLQFSVDKLNFRIL